MDKKISQLTAATTPLAGTETLPIVQAGSTVKATVQDVLGYVVNDSTNSVLKTVYSSNDIGLKLDFASQYYSLGENFGANGSINIDVSNNETGIFDSTIIIGSTSGNLTLIGLSDVQGVINTQYNSTLIGIKLDFANGEYYFGDFTVSGNYYIWCDSSNGVALGDPLNKVNNTYLKIDDTNQRWELSGNLEANTAGASASKYLKVRIGSTDYKIALLNN